MRLGLVRAVVPKAEGVGWMRGLGAGVRSRCPAGTWYWRGRARRHALGVTAGLRNGHFQRGGAPDAAFGLIRATRLARRRALGVTAGLRNGHCQRGGAPGAAFGLIRATPLGRRRASGSTAWWREGRSERGRVR